MSGRSDGIDILWETLTEDLNPVEAGRLSVNILEEPVAGIRYAYFRVYFHRQSPLVLCMCIQGDEDVGSSDLCLWGSS